MCFDNNPLKSEKVNLKLLQSQSKSYESKQKNKM